MNIWAIHRELNSGGGPGICTGGELPSDTVADEIEWNLAFEFVGMESLVSQVEQVRPTAPIEILSINAHGMPGAMRIGGAYDMLAASSLATYADELRRLRTTILTGHPRRPGVTPTIILSSCAVAADETGRRFCESLSANLEGILLVAFTTILETGGSLSDEGGRTGEEGVTGACRVPRAWITERRYDPSHAIDQQETGLSCGGGGGGWTGCELAVPSRRNARHFLNGNLVWPEGEREPHRGRRRGR